MDNKMQFGFEKSPSPVSSEIIPPLAASRMALMNWRPSHGFLLIALVLLCSPINNSHAGQNPGSADNAHQNSADENIITLGLLPYLSPTALMKTWQPFADYIEEVLHKKVVIKTAPDFKTFLERTAEGRYQLLMTAPHFAALAVKNNGYQLIAGHSNDLAGDIVVAKDSEFQSISDLRGKIFATPHPLAAVTILAELMLRQHGLIPGITISMKTTASHNAALIDVAKGRADAAVAVGGLYRRLNTSYKYPQLRKLAATDEIPHAMYIANSSFSKDDITKLRNALTTPNPSALGKAAFAEITKSFYGGHINIVSPQIFNRLVPIIAILETKIAP